MNFTFFYVKVYSALEVDSVLLSSVMEKCLVRQPIHVLRQSRVLLDVFHIFHVVFSVVDSRPSLLIWRRVHSRCFRCVLCP